MSKYTSLYFDVDNTLLDFYAAEKHAIKQLFENYGIKNDDRTIALYSKINQKYWQLFEKGVMKKSEILVARFKETFSLLGEERDCAEVNESYFTLLSSCHFLMPDATEVLSRLKQSGYFIYAATNGLLRTQEKRIKESGLINYFDGIFVSESAGHQKPEREYYQYILENTPEKDKSKILVIGDSMTSDIKGGINFGVDTCWFNGFNEEKLFEPTYEIKKLKEIFDIL